MVLEGAGFDVTVPANNLVKFTSADGGTVNAGVVQSGGTQLQVRVPVTAVSGYVSVAVTGRTSNTVRWTNPAGTITIVKAATPDGPQDFTFTSDLPGIAPFVLNDSEPGVSNQRTFSNVDPGMYRFTENTVSGWTLSSIACTPSFSVYAKATTRTAILWLDAGDHITCVFTNARAAGALGLAINK